MAPLEVICASFGRSGTDSLRTALNKLAYDKDVFFCPSNMHDIRKKEPSRGGKG